MPLKPGVNVEISQGIATITFNRPKTLNAITPEGAYRMSSQQEGCGGGAGCRDR